ncbi:subtilisin-like serine protease [Microbacterium testaceum StLB037]|uniref:Subtilisin-like serine protease n=1 Tax=Microbacterium testaceum (strain StLB037) TaxID=979556 RepID=E8NDQ0_MICTS|nr:S8 family serine peptidase [Microbacterium testaceum]BAJ73726.1 subtilisin-like serine protease [Microbacterium testaceum StLB037]
MRTSVGFALALILVAGGVAPAALAATPAAPESCRTIPVDADAPLRADIARERFGVDGTGVKVGVISDSFARTSAPGATVEDDIANGLLPGPGNPCGHETPVHVVREAAAGTDEGRAMVQLVHGIAPGAELAFASVDEGHAASVIEAIEMLVADGADVIVDDVEPKNEPVFQRSPVGEAIARANAAGVAYFSAAGNSTMTATQPRPGQTASPINGWETSAYRPMACPDEVVTAAQAQGWDTPVDCLDADPGEGTDATLGYTVPGNGGITVDVQWGEPLGRVSGLLVPVVTVDGQALATPPTRMLDGTPGFTVTLPASATPMEVEIAVARIVVPDAETSLPLPPISVLFGQNAALQSAEYWRSAGDDIVGRTNTGHPGDPATLSIGAAPAADPFDAEFFSSYGPVVWAFGPATADPPSTILAPRPVLTKPDVLSVDRARNSVLGMSTDEPGVKLFIGTSAAAPNAAAVAALVLSKAPDLGQEGLRSLLTSTAYPLDAPNDFVSVANSVGAGLIDAEAALAALPPAPTPTPSPTPSPEPTPTPTTPEPTLTPEAGPSHLANSGMDASATLPLAIGAIVLLVVGGIVVVVVRARSRRR